VQTTFRADQLADPDIAESDKILRACVHCGFCTATCPTYVLLGDELDSPRGRIYLIKDMLENDRPATAEVVKHIDRCLSCLACMTTCPSGVHYMHLVDHARAHVEQTYRRPLADRIIRGVLAKVMPDLKWFRLSLMAAQIGKPFARLFEAVGLKPIASMLRLAPAGLPRRPMHGPRVFPAQGPKAQGPRAQGPRAQGPRGRVALLSGCIAPVLSPSINAAAIRVLTRNGIEVVLARGEGCCGSLVHHMGREHAALDFARANIDAWMREIDGEGLDAILMTASGCGTTVKDYAFMLRNDARYAAKAARISALARDISEFLATLKLAGMNEAPPLVVAYHGACSLQHGQKITREPKQLLSGAGFVVKDIPEGHLCCGSAGTYNILQSDLAVRLRDRKAANIAKVAPDVVAAGNVGCITQIASASAIPVVHPIELLDWAGGGPMPQAIAERRRSARSTNIAV
jgi:glycolate oxidase iron-sulfur subunit